MQLNSILRLPQVIQLTGLSRSTVYSRVKEGKLSPPISLGARAVGWLVSDIESFIATCVASSRAPSR